MLRAIQIDDEVARLVDEPTIALRVAACTHQLTGAVVSAWQRKGWQVVEQAYDLPDVYVSYIEVEVRNDSAIPIRCPRHDLYGFYVLAGSVRITTTDQQTLVLRTDAGRYRLSYLPAAAYTCHFKTGIHHIFYFVTRPTTLLREPSPELATDIAPLEALREKLAAPTVSANLSMTGAVDDAIRRFLHHPGSSYLKRYLTVQVLMITLLLQACEALRVRLATEQVGQALARRMRTYVDERVMDGEYVDVASVARIHRVSYAYAKLIFRTHVGQPLGGYIRGCKLAQARRMLEAGESPAEVARYVCWTYSHFSKAFKAKYGVLPGSYRNTL